MSGTSLDGLDLCYCRFDRSERWEFEILYAETVPYPEVWEEKLKNSFHLGAQDLLALNSEYGFYLGERTREFIQNNSIRKVDVVASHGHTVFHQPKRSFTLQIGDGRAIKTLVKSPVVYDFRMQDILLGGNGAPLVPIGDELLFSEFSGCLNLGGFSNISMKMYGKRVAFDICPVNIVLNKISEKLGKKFDENGDFAREGKIIPELLAKLNHLSFYNENFPKSLGAEWTDENIYPLLETGNAKDLLATLTEHIAVQISGIFNQYSLKNVLITGGGTYNQFLIEKISEKTCTHLTIPEKNVINYKEAMIFALLGILKILNENNVISSATGSYMDHSSGIIA